MPTKFEETKANRKWREAIFPVAKGILQLSEYGFVASAMSAFKTAFEALTKEQLSPDELAQRLWCEAFSHALAQALKACRVTILQTNEELVAAIAGYIAQSFDTKETFGEAGLVEPTGFAGYRPVREAFPDFLRRIDPELKEDEPEAWRNKLDDCLRCALVQVWSGDLERYGAITDRFEGPVAEGARREASWMRHYGRIRDKFERAPVFSPDEADLSIKLKDVYVRLRCCWHELIKEEPDTQESERASRLNSRRKLRQIAHLNHLHEEMNAWLEAPDDRRNAIRIVAGGPGSGKSSFARAFACESIAANHWRVIFVELQRINLANDLHEALQTHLTKHMLDFHDNPFDWRREDQRPYLLIFDGLDELARSDDRATDLTRRFVYNLKRLLHSNEIKDRRIKAVVLGRSSAAEEGRKDAELEQAAVLHVLPLRPPTLRDLGLRKRLRQKEAKNALKDIVDPEGILEQDDVDQRTDYWRRWEEAHGKVAGKVPEGLTHEALDDLSAEPLLLHLLIVSGYMTPERWQEAAANRNRVYEAIFEKVFARDKDKDAWTAARLEQGDFFTLMECLGLASWAGGGRTGGDEDFKRLRACHSSRRQENKFSTLSNTDLRGVALQFYTRHELDTDTGFEFIHKSFGEYLTARAMLVRARRITDDEQSTNEALGKAWLEICGHAAVTAEILRFLRDQARLLTLDEAKKQKDALVALMDWTLSHGLPAHFVTGARDYRVIETRQRHGEGNLLAVLNALAQQIIENEGVEYAVIAPSWPDSTAFWRMAERLQMTGTYSSVLKTCLSHIDFVSGIEEEYVALFGIRLSRADLRAAKLCEVDLIEANLRGTNLRRADLRGSDLTDAKLDRANLREADLSNAFVPAASLTGANLRGANLSSAYLEGVNLKNADLRDADLRDADLTEADLTEAECIGLKLGSAQLHCANLSESKNLTQEQVNSAKGNRQTRLPAKLIYPNHWEDD